MFEKYRSSELYSVTYVCSTCSILGCVANTSHSCLNDPVLFSFTHDYYLWRLLRLLSTTDTGQICISFHTKPELLPTAGAVMLYTQLTSEGYFC